MSSDSDLEPTPPKRRRHSQLMSSSDNSGSPAVATQRSERFKKHGDDNDDVFVLSDIEIDASPKGSASSGVNSNSGSPSTATSPLDLSKTPKRSSESITNAAKEEAAGSSTGIESDSNDLEAEKCPICWLPFTNQEVANPSTCDHRFCFHCIIEWTKTTNTCPVDRQTFNDINVRPKFGAKVTRLVPVATRVSTDTDMDAVDAEPDSDSNDNYDLSGDEMNLPESEMESTVELTFSTEEVEDDDWHDFELEYSSSNDNYVNPVVVVVSSSDEEVHLSSPYREYNELSPSSSPNPATYFSQDLSNSSYSIPSLPRSPTVSLSPSPSFSPSPSPSPLPSPPSPSLPSSSPSRSLSHSSSRSFSHSSSRSLSRSSSRSLSHSSSRSPSRSPSTSTSRSPSLSRSPSCCSLSNASSVSFSSSS